MQNIKAVLTLISVILPTALLGTQECLIIGHRGASYDAPENTLASVNLAWAKGARAAEIDVHLSADDQVVVVHDFNTKKLFGRDREVKDQTYAELLELDAGRHKGEQWEGERIPLLDQVLATVPDGRMLVVEIKVGPEIIPELEKSFAQSGLGPDQIIITSGTSPALFMLCSLLLDPGDEIIICNPHYPSITSSVNLFFMNLGRSGMWGTLAIEVSVFAISTSDSFW